jgi:LysR family hydrogen peroxide-inducible transcriptional activator
MTIVQLEYLLAVANHGSFSAAAVHCFVTQSALSVQIARLEDELGAILLDRNSKPIVPTDAGLVVLERARKAVSAFYGTKESLSDLRGEISGKLRLGVIPTVSPYLMPRFIPEFTKRYPEVELDICDMFTADLVDALNRDTIDIAILADSMDVGIQVTVLFKDKLYVYVAPGNNLYGRDSILTTDIDIREMLLLSEGNCLRSQVLTLCEANDKIKSSYHFTSGSLETLMRTVDTTSALTVIPGMAIEYIPEEKRKQIRPFAGVDAYRTITMAAGRTYAKESLVHAVKTSVLTVAEHYALSEFLLP